MHFHHHDNAARHSAHPTDTYPTNWVDSPSFTKRSPAIAGSPTLDLCHFGHHTSLFIMDYYLSTLRSALAYVEPLLPPIFGPQAQPGEKQIGNLKIVTAKRRNVISPSYFGPMLDKFETEMDGSDDVEPPSATSPAVDEEDDEPEPGGPYGCDDDIRDLLIEFYQSLHNLWPVECEATHKLMLRLVPRRQYVGGDHKAEVLELDTLSSWHDQRWGRIVYHVR